MAIGDEETSDTDSGGQVMEDDGLEGSSASRDEELEVPIVEMVPPVRPSAAIQRAGFVDLDNWDLGETFSQRGILMRSVPRFLWGSCRVVFKNGARGNLAWSGEKE